MLVSYILILSRYNVYLHCHCFYIVHVALLLSSNSFSIFILLFVGGERRVTRVTFHVCVTYTANKADSGSYIDLLILHVVLLT